MINLAGEQGLDDTQNCVGRKIFHNSSSWGWCWCTNQYFLCLPSLTQGAGCAGPPGCPCHPSHTTSSECCPGKSMCWDTRCFTNARHLAWCSLSFCSVWGQRRGPWMHSETHDSNSLTMNWSQTTQSHYMPLHHSFKLKHLVRNPKEDAMS